MKAGIENFPLRPNREVRHGREKARRKVREKRRPRPRAQDFLRVIIVCFEMDVPYFKVWRGEQGRGPRAVGIFPPGARAWKARERIQENGVSLTLVTDG